MAVRRSRRSQTLVYGIVILWVLVSLAPVVWMLLQSIKPSAQVFAIPPPGCSRRRCRTTGTCSPPAAAPSSGTT